MSEERGTDLRVEHSGDIVVVAVRGELDIHSSPELQGALEQADSTGGVVLDLSGLTFLDSAGLRVILAGHQAMTEGGRRFVVRAPSAPTRRLFEITGLDEVLAIEENIA